MTRLGITLTIGLAAITTFSAAGKLLGLDDVEQLLDDVGVHGLLRNALPYVQITGAVGAVVGLLRWPKLGIAATLGLFGYYSAAVLLHLNEDVDGIGIPAGYAVLALAAAAIRTRTALRISAAPADERSATIRTDELPRSVQAR